MIFIRLEHLSRETKEKLDKERAKLHRWEISEEEHSERHDAIMDNFRIMTEAILSHKDSGQQEWFGN